MSLPNLWPRLASALTRNGVTFTPDGTDVIADGTASGWAVCSISLKLTEGDYLLAGNSPRIQISLGNGEYLHPSGLPQHIPAGSYQCEISLPSGTVCNQERFAPFLYSI